MLKLWSELPRPRTTEVGADVATFAWVGIWLVLAWKIYDRLVWLATGVAQIREGGLALERAGDAAGGALARVPLIGEPAGEAVRLAFSATASPFVAAGGSLEGLVILVAWLLALLVLTFPSGLWLTRYLPWRLERIRVLRAAHRVIRKSPAARGPAADAEGVRRLLASRAIHRLSYEALLAFSPDPFGDWLAGRYDRLAQAELASAGLRLR